MSLAAAKETSVDAAVAAFLSGLDGTFTLKDEQRMVLKEDNTFAPLSTGFSKS